MARKITALRVDYRNDYVSIRALGQNARGTKYVLRHGTTKVAGPGMENLKIAQARLIEQLLAD